jgi:hypothetical protein
MDPSGSLSWREELQLVDSVATRIEIYRGLMPTWAWRPEKLMKSLLPAHYHILLYAATVLRHRRGKYRI